MDLQQVDLLQLHLASKEAASSKGAAASKGLTGKGAAAGKGLPKEEKEACVTLACCNNHTRTSCTVYRGQCVQHM